MLAYVGTYTIEGSTVVHHVEGAWNLAWEVDLVRPFTLEGDKTPFEVCQIWIPGRGSALGNWLASSLGAIIGVTVAYAFSRLATRKGCGTSETPD